MCSFFCCFLFAMEELYSYKEKTLQKNKAGKQNTTTEQQQQK